MVLTKRDLSKRFETSLLGEVTISALVTAAVLIAVVWNLPDSAIRRSVVPTLRPAAAPFGLEQVWSMYAPEPIQRLEVVEVHVLMADGEDRLWTVDRESSPGGPISWHLWYKFKEQVIRQESIRAGLAEWVVHKLTRPGEHPVRVEIIARTTDLDPPGQHSVPTTQLETLYEEALGERR